MPETLEDLVMRRPPSPDRPLLGSVVLVVEDSRHACEALRLICQRSGARIRRAESLASAERHLRSYRPSIAVIDLGLPDGSGLELIRRLSRTVPRACAIVATSGDETLREAALAAGAEAFLPKPLRSVGAFQEVVLSLIPPEERPGPSPRSGPDEVVPDAIALRDDLALASELLRSDPDAATRAYVTGFLRGLAKTADDAELGEIARRLGEAEDAARMDGWADAITLAAARLALG